MPWKRINGFTCFSFKRRIVYCKRSLGFLPGTGVSGFRIAYGQLCRWNSASASRSFFARRGIRFTTRPAYEKRLRSASHCGFASAPSVARKRARSAWPALSRIR